MKSIINTPESPLLVKLAKGYIEDSEIIGKSRFFTKKETISTELPILNLALSGTFDGGITPSLTILSGESRTFKSLLALYCMKAYLNTYKDAIALLYDSEFGITPEYLSANEIDVNRIIHIPVTNIEEMKFDMISRFDKISRGDKVFIMVDSLGAIPSKKEVEDAINEKSVADMTRAKAIRSWLRLMIGLLNIKELPMFVINHVYQTMEMYPTTVNSGGKSVLYLANTVFVISRFQEKEGTELMGYNFNITVDKSRFVREKSKFSLSVSFENGIDLYSGLFELAMESGHIVQDKKGWYKIANKPDFPSVRKKIFSNKEVWDGIFSKTNFKSVIESKYGIATKSIFSSNLLTEKEDDNIKTIDIEDEDIDDDK
jgi:RecA/RadA recombinase